MFEKFNLTNTLPEGIELKDMEFVSLDKFEGMKVKVEGFYFSDKGLFGRQVIVVGNGYQINMPARAVAVFEEIKNNAKMLKAVLEGHLMLTNIKHIELGVDDETGEMKTTTTYDLKDC